MQPSGPFLNLSSASELQKELFGVMTDGVLVVDEDGIIIDCNPAFHRRLGFEWHEMVGREVRTLDPPEFADLVPKRMAEIRARGQVTFETAHRRKDGTVMPVEINAHMCEAQDKTVFFGIVRDITSRKELEAELQQSLEIYTAAINTPALGFWVVDGRGRFVEVNDAYLRMSGYERQEFLALGVVDVEAVEDPAETEAHIRKVTDQGCDRFRTVHRRKDGSRWPAEIVTTYTPLRGGQFMVFVEDIGEAVRHEEDLAKKTLMLEQAERIARFGHWEIRADTGDLFWSDEVYRIHGLPVGSPIDVEAAIAAYHPDDRDLVADYVRRAFEEKRGYQFELRIVRDDGSLRYVQSTGVPRLDDAGEVRSLFGVFQDVTDLVTAQKKLKKSRKDLECRVEERTRELLSEVAIRRQTEVELRKLTQAVEQSGHLIFITDTDGVIEYVNPKFTELLGYGPEEAIGRMPSLIKSGDTPPEVYADLWQTILAGREWRGELKDRCKDGSVFWASVLISPVRDEAGAITHFVAMHEDITERKVAEEATKQARRAAEIANRAKSEILANMSHELRTPLNAIIGFSALIREQAFGAVGNDRYLEYAADIHDSGEHLLELINDVLDVSAIEAGKVELQEEPVDVCRIVATSLRLVEPRAERGQVALEDDVPDSLPALMADSRRIKQVMLNLISNAVKFTPEGGRVTVSASVDGDGELVLSVADTGVGMTDEEQAKAVTQFGQVDSGLDRRHEGTGLGLPLSIGLVDLHGGRLDIDSVKGEGTTVRVVFPPERVIGA